MNTLANLLSRPLAICPDTIAVKAPERQSSFIVIEREALRACSEVD